MIKLLQFFNPFITESLICVKCGARGDKYHQLVNSINSALFIGFEPDKKECQTLNNSAPKNYKYFPVAVSDKKGKKKLYITNNPSCSSLFHPNYAFINKFMDCAYQLKVKNTKILNTVSLDEYLPKEGINHIDLLELDTQGSDYDILQGAQSLIKQAILAIKTEVFFGPMYQNQFFFADTDKYLRKFEFIFFDISRIHYRRQNFPRNLQTKGQILWGDALYLKDYQKISGKNIKEKLLKLALIATYYDLYDYALEIIDSLLKQKTIKLKPQEIAQLTNLQKSYQNLLNKKQSLLNFMVIIDKTLFSSLQNIILAYGKAAAMKIIKVHDFIRFERNFPWNS